MRIGSLFSGAGGLDLAALELFPGSSMVWHAEVDTAASKVLAHHWPEVPNLGDVTQIDWHAVEPVDVLTGGFPCQDVSLAGRRAGLSAETRSGLWSHMAAAIDVLRPRYVLVENVRGLLSAGAVRGVEPGSGAVGDMGGRHVLRAIGAVLGSLADLGFDAEWTCLPASKVGAAHRRERVFILAFSADSDGDPIREQPESESGCSGAAFTGRAGTDAANAESERRPDGEVCRDGEQIGTVAGAGDGDHAGRASAGVRQLGRSAAVVAGGVALLPTPRTTDANGAGAHGSGGLDLRTAATQSPWGKYAAAIHRQEQASRPAPPPTEPGAKSNPRLSAAFAEWLMFWPAGWVTDPAIGLSRNDQLRIIGNGVVPPQAVAAFRQLLSHLHPTVPSESGDQYALAINPEGGVG